MYISTNNPKIKIDTKAIKNKKQFKDRPSLKKTKKKEKYTSAVPVSPCNKIIADGIKNTKEVNRMCLAFFRSILYESNILARNKAVENLENSDG